MHKVVKKSSSEMPLLSPSPERAELRASRPWGVCVCVAVCNGDASFLNTTPPYTLNWHQHECLS